MSVEDWQAVGIVSGALLAVLTLAGLIYRKLVRPMWRAARKAFRRVDEVADEILGDKAKGIPSLKAQIAAQGEQLAEQGRLIAEHLEWHGQPGGRAAGPTRPEPNNNTPTRRRTR